MEIAKLIYLRTVGRALGILGLVFILGIASVWMLPIDASTWSVQPQPIDSYEQATARIEAIVEAEQREPLNPKCNSRLFSHGRKTERVIVFLHGFTSCPQQFVPLAVELYRQGITVYIPRQPHHGLADRLTDDLRSLTASELVSLGSEAVDIAQGLGDTVVVAGLSGGGTIAMWIAQNRSDVDMVVAMEPFLGANAVPALFTRPVANLAHILPNQFAWWDGEGKATSAKIVSYSYPRYASRAVGELMRLGLAIQQSAVHHKPAVSQLQFVLSDADHAVNRREINRAIRLWSTYHSEIVSVYEFAGSHNLPHDFITVEHPENQVDLVYPVLIEILHGS